MITAIGHLRAFCHMVGDIQLFPYQIQFLTDCIDKKRVVGIFGRQMGKTTTISLFALWKAMQVDKYKILIIAPTDRQAGELFGRLRAFAENSNLVKNFIKSSTQREIVLTNDSVIRAMPTGDFGHNIRGQTADLLILEESSYIKTDIVNQVVMPMIAATDGDIIQIGTPFFKNHFYEVSLSENYHVHQYDHTHSPLIKEDFIEEQKRNLTHMEFTMEYLAEFIDETDSYFTSDLINSCTEEYEFYPEVMELHPKSRFFLGVDFARMGQDSSVFIVIEKRWDTDKIKVVDIIETKHKRLTDAVGRIMLMHRRYNFERIYLDETGMGAGPTDVLREKIPSKIEPVTFTLQSKQDIYSNLKALMEKGIITLPNMKKLIFELLDLKYEATASGHLKIHHSERGHDDYCDALALAVYFFKPRRGYVPEYG